MPFDPNKPTIQCVICGSRANRSEGDYGERAEVDCVRCGDYRTSQTQIAIWRNSSRGSVEVAIASHFIRKLQKHGTRAVLTAEFFNSIKGRSLPTPAEASNNIILWLGDSARIAPGSMVSCEIEGVISETGALDRDVLSWLTESLKVKGLLDRGTTSAYGFAGRLTFDGWTHYEELKRTSEVSNHAFFARKFENTELDTIYENCLRKAVTETGYELRTATQKAGLINAIIENEIRSCKFLVVDLTDGNAGAYWEAGFAEGLGKPVIYICREDVKTHFDTEHRHTVPWHLEKMTETAKLLKAVIRNTLLGDAKQSDD